MSHGGNPEAGTSSIVGIDSSGLQINSPAGPDSWVIPAADTFTVAMSWYLTGSWASWLVGLPITYTVTYTFAGLGNADGPTLVVANPTVPGQLTYGDPDTTVTVLAGSLPVGQYELLATVTFAGSPPMSAYVEIPVLEIY